MIYFKPIRKFGGRKGINIFIDPKCKLPNSLLDNGNIKHIPALQPDERLTEPRYVLKYRKKLISQESIRFVRSIGELSREKDIVIYSVSKDYRNSPRFVLYNLFKELGYPVQLG